MSEYAAILDLPAALNWLDGDKELFLTLAGMFLERTVQDIVSIRAALDAHDLPRLAKEAHRLKGSAMEFCAAPMVEAAKQLEHSARSGVANDMSVLYGTMQQELDRLTTALEAIIHTGFPE